MFVVPDLVGPVVPAGRLRDQIQPNLAIDELTLRPWRKADAPGVFRAYQDPAIQRWHVRSMTEHEAEAWVASWSQRWSAETGAGWAVCEGDALLGRVGLRALDLAEGVGEAAYWVLPAARGRGVASRALLNVSAWLFTHIGLHRIELAHFTRNEGSCLVASKAGYALGGDQTAAGIARGRLARHAPCTRAYRATLPTPHPVPAEDPLAAPSGSTLWAARRS